MCLVLDCSFYQYSDDKAPIATSEKSDAAERLMAVGSFVAFRAACSSDADQKVLKPFYDFDGPGVYYDYASLGVPNVCCFRCLTSLFVFALDDSKHYFVIEAPEYDRHGMSFESLEGYIKDKHEALANVMYVAMSAR